MTHWQAQQINYTTNSLLKNFEAAVLQRESVYSRLIALSSLENPGLNIDGPGTIEFPVSMKNLVPQLIGNRPEPEDGSQWEMESKYVRFDNPNWEQFLRDVVRRNCDTKGSSVQEHAVQFEFRKLVLFDSGESYLSQSCYADDDDNSGILLVFLPPKSSSKEAGGIDYRLVLYYKLTFPSKVDFTNALYAEDNLRRVLVKWNKGKYSCEAEDYYYDFDSESASFIFHRLSRNYDLSNGKPVLSDEDRKMTSFIRRVAEGLDFILCLGHYCRSIDSIDGSISHVIDMDGDHVIGSQSLCPVRDQAIGEALPDNPLSCTVMVLFRAKQMYDIIFSSDTIEEMFQELVSISDRPAKKVKSMAMYIITILEYDKFICLDVLVSMIKFTLTRLDIELWTEAVNVSLASTYPDLLCKQAVLLRSLQVFGFEKVRSRNRQQRQATEFNSSRFERLLDTALFGNLYHFLRKIPSNLAIDDDADAINLWCNERLRLGPRSFGVDRDVNVPFFIHMAHKHGIHYLLEIRHSTSIHSPVPFLFADKFIRALKRKKRSILKANVQFDTVRATAILESQGCKSSVLSSEHAIDILVDRWLNEAIGDLLARLGEKTGCFDYYSDLIGEYFDLLLSWHETHEHLTAESLKFIELCIIAGHVERCGTILDAIEGLDGHEPTKLELCIVPLVWDLGPLLQAKHISSPPFAPFFRRVIERYVRCFLGTRTRNPREMFLRQKINKRFLCACTEVKEFLHQLYVPQRYFSGSKAALRHIKCNTTVIYELANIKLVDRPRIALQIAMQRWENRVEDLQDLLSCIGSEHIVERVMGDRYADLKVAMEGKGEIP